MKTLIIYENIDEMSNDWPNVWFGTNIWKTFEFSC